ncbi:MAG: hypothetical protein ACYDBH_16130 [Acidobacteriaceae bacterium]
MTLTVVGMVLCLGVASPAGGVYLFIFNHVPFGQLFRDPLSKFVPLCLLGASVLFFLGIAIVMGWISRLAERVRGGRGRRRLVVALCALAMGGAILTYGFPLTLGLVMNSRVQVGHVVVAPGNSVPGDFRTVRDLLSRQPSGYRTLVLPLSPTGYRWEKWQYGYTGPDLSWLLLETPTISSSAGQLGPAGSVMTGLASLPVSGQLALAERLGVADVVVEKDVVFVGPALGSGLVVPPVGYEDALKRAGGKVLFQDSRLSVYRLPAPSPLVQFATQSLPTKPVVNVGVGTNGYPVSAEVTDPTGGEILFNEAYSNEWQAAVTRTSRTESLLCRSLVGKTLHHSLYDGYGNAFAVPAGGGSCTVTVTITNDGSWLMFVGALVALLAGLSAGGWMALAEWRRRAGRHPAGTGNVRA